MDQTPTGPHDDYDDEIEGNDEEDSRAVFDWYDLGCILDIIAGIVPPDEDGYDEFRFSTEERSAELESDFTGFVPVAFIREIGDTYIASQQIMLVNPRTPAAPSTTWSKSDVGCSPNGRRRPSR